jgi:hypothetical protein
MIPEVLVRAVLELVRAGGGRASWYTLGSRLPLLDVPLDPDVMTVLRELRARGWVTRTLVGGGMDAWGSPPRGRHTWRRVGRRPRALARTTS